MGKYRIRPGRFVLAIIFLTCIAVLTFWGLWISLAWAKNMVMLNLLDINFLTQDEIRKTRAISGLVIRKEEPIKAPVPGELHLLAQDGERLPVGAPLAEIRGVSSRTVYSPRAGVLCTHVDGLENLLVPGMINVLDMSAVEKISNSTQTLTGEVDGGQIIGKVVDNLQPVLIYITINELEEFLARSFTKGAVARLIFQGKEITGIITEVRAVDNTISLFLEVLKYPEDFVHERQVQLELVTRRLAGFLVSEKAIVFKDGQPGIYVVSKQEVKWQRVSVKDRLNGMVALSDDSLNNNMRYISNPDWAWEGARLDLRG